MKAIKLGLETESLHLFFQHRGLNLFEFADIAASLGLDGVQINIIPDLNLNQRFGTLQSNDESYLKRLNDKILSLNLYCEIDTRWCDYELLKDDIAIAKTLGAKRVRSYLKPQNGEISRANFLKNIDDLKRICELLEQYDIELALENHEFESSDDLLYAIEKIGSNRIGVLYDTGNSMMVRRDPITEAKKLLPYIKMVHFKDHLVCFDGDEPVVSGTFLGDGSVDIDTMFTLLASHTDANINLETCYPYSATFKDPAVIAARKSGAKITKELLKQLPLDSISDELYAQKEIELAPFGLEFSRDLSDYFSDFCEISAAYEVNNSKDLQNLSSVDLLCLRSLAGDSPQGIDSLNSDKTSTLTVQSYESTKSDEVAHCDYKLEISSGKSSKKETSDEGMSFLIADELKFKSSSTDLDCAGFSEYKNSLKEINLNSDKSLFLPENVAFASHSTSDNITQAYKLLRARWAANIRAYAGENKTDNLRLKADQNKDKPNDTASRRYHNTRQLDHCMAHPKQIAQHSLNSLGDTIQIGKIVHAALKAKSAERFEFKGAFEIKKAPLPKYIKPMQYYYPHKISERVLDELLALQLNCVKQGAKKLINLRKKFYKRRENEK